MFFETSNAIKTAPFPHIKESSYPEALLRCRTCHQTFPSRKTFRYNKIVCFLYDKYLNYI